MKLGEVWRVACGTMIGATLACALVASPARADTKKYRIALSNSYIGNEWRVEMINMLKAYVKKISRRRS